MKSGSTTSPRANTKSTTSRCTKEDNNKKTILVTGAAGFIGSNLVKAIYKQLTGAQIVGIDNMNDYYDVRFKEERNTHRVTIFGYSAPVSDVEALGMMKEAWGDIGSRDLEQFEIIDVRQEEEVRKSWS